MDILLDNAFILIFLVFCLGMHLFGHRHGHARGRDGDAGGIDRPSRDPDPAAGIGRRRRP